jgi:hypothetical protein
MALERLEVIEVNHFFGQTYKIKPTIHIIIIINLLGIIKLYRFHANFDLHRFVQKSHEFCAMLG